MRMALYSYENAIQRPSQRLAAEHIMLDASFKLKDKLYSLLRLTLPQRCSVFVQNKSLTFVVKPFTRV